MALLCVSFYENVQVGNLYFDTNLSRMKLDSLFLLLTRLAILNKSSISTHVQLLQMPFRHQGYK